MLALRPGSAEEEAARQLSLRSGPGAVVGSGCNGGVRREAPSPRPAPLRVSDPVRYAAFLREAAAFAEAAAQREDTAERARAARDGDAYRTRQQRAAAAEEAAAKKRAAADEERRRKAREEARDEAPGSGNAGSIRSFDSGLDYYEILGVEANVGHKALRKAYKKQALLLHPDKAPPGSDPAACAAAFATLQAAADILLDKATRDAYDKARSRRTGIASAPRRTAARQPAASQSAKQGAAKMQDVPKPAARRMEAFVSLAACCTGGTLRVSAPRVGRADGDVASLRLDVPPAVPEGDTRLFAGEGDGPGDGCTGPNGDIVVVLRHAPREQDAPFSRRGAKDIVMDAPLQAAPRPGDAMWALIAPTPRGGAVAVAAPLAGALLGGGRCVEARVAREGLPDAAAPWHEAEHGDLFVRTALPPMVAPPMLRCALRPGAILLLGDALKPETAAAHAAVAAATHAKPGASTAVCLRFRRAPRGAEPAPRCAVTAAVCAGITACVASVNLTWRVIEAPLDDARSAIALLEDEWSALDAADVIVLHCPDEAVPSADAALYAPPPPPGTARATLAVVHAAAVAQRAQPSLEGQILGASQPRAEVVADARFKRWIRVANAAPDAKERWMLTWHPTLGRLLHPVGANGAAALAALPVIVPAGGPPARLRVLHAPKVAVRAAPATSAAVLDVRHPGDVISALAVCPRTGWALVPMPRGFGHMMLRHPDLGPLLEVLPDEGEDYEAPAPVSAMVPKAAAAPLDAEVSREAAVRALCGAAHACGLSSALRRAWWRGALLVGVGGAGGALLGAAPGRPPRDAPLPYIVRQGGQGGRPWAALERAAAAWPSDTPARGVLTDEAVLLPPQALWAAEAPVPQRGWAAECSRDGLRRGCAARAPPERIAAQRAHAKAAVAAAAAREAIADAVFPGDLQGRDGAGVRRGLCADARCMAFARPRLSATGLEAHLLLVCAACGAAAAEHTALM